MTSRRDYAYYKKHAQDVNPEDITSSEKNKDIMQKLRDGDPDFTSLYIILDNDSNDNEEEFFVLEGDDLDWLGYFIGESKTLEFLRLSCGPFPPVGLLEGICRNRSIQSFEINEDDPADMTFFHFAPFFERNHSLTSFKIGCFRLASDQAARNFAMALVRCKFLKHLCFEGSPIDGGIYSDEAFKDIIVTALNFLPQLEKLSFEEYWIEDEGYAALGNALRMGGMGKLRILNLICTNVNDNGLLPLVAGMKHCQNLVRLNLCGNDQITLAGLRTLSAFLQSESCRLESLNLGGVRMSDEGARVFAAGLTTSKALKCLTLSYNRFGDDGIAALVSAITASANENLEALKLSGNWFGIAGIRSLSTLVESERFCLKLLDLGDVDFATEGMEEAAAVIADALANNTSLMYLGVGDVQNDVGMEAFSKLLCDTSSINNVYSSNHTLEVIGNVEYVQEPKHEDVRRYLALNRNSTKLEPRQRPIIPMCKILIHYPDLADMKPFFQWKLKFLPLVAAWFQKASATRTYFKESVEAFECRELSAMYKFIRGVPLLVADGYWSQQLKQVRLKKRNFEATEEQLLLNLLAKKRKLEEEEVEVWHRLGEKRASV